MKYRTDLDLGEVVYIYIYQSSILFQILGYNS